MAAHRACGFHTHRWADDFEASASQLAGLSPTTFVSPLASDPDDIRREAASPECAAALASLDELVGDRAVIGRVDRVRSEEHTSELQSLMRISYAVFCLKKNKHSTILQSLTHITT